MIDETGVPGKVIDIFWMPAPAPLALAVAVAGFGFVVWSFLAPARRG